MGVSSGSVPDFYDIYQYLNWVRVSRYHEVSISNIHKYRDASIYRVSNQDQWGVKFLGKSFT